jgi:hypothetical protein
MTTLEKKALLKKILKLMLILIAFTIITTGLVLLYAKRYDLIGWINALFFNGFLLFAFSWMMIISNANLFTVSIYGIKQFLSSLLGRKLTKNIIEYRDSRGKVPRYIVITTLCFGMLCMLISLGIYYIS